MELISPKTMAECLSYLAEEARHTRLIAGGTDAVVQMKEGKDRPDLWLNIRGLQELRFIREEGDEIHIGSLTTHTDMVNSKLLKSKAQALQDAAWEVGAAQIRNMGTIGGNLATASPAGDTIPALYILDALIELESVRGTRRVKIDDFYLGPRKTVIQKDEMIKMIIIRPQKSHEISIFQKLGPRRAQAISIVNVAVKLIMGPNTRECLGGTIAFGSVAPTVIRANKCQGMLPLNRLTDDTIHDIGKVAWKEVAPISDIRASAEYRKEMAGALLERSLYRLMRRWESQ